MKHGKRMLSLLLALAMVLGMGPLPALAEEVEGAKCDCVDAVCTEGNVKEDCPVCGAENADLTQCAAPAAQNGTTQERTKTPETPKPEGTQGQSTDNLGTDNPGADTPGTDNPGTDNPGTDNPGTDNPGTDNPGTDNPGTDNPGTDNPGTDNPGTDNPGTDNPGTDNPSTDNPGTDNPGTDNPGTDNPGTDNPGTDNPDQGTEGDGSQNGDTLTCVCAGLPACAEGALNACDLCVSDMEKCLGTPAQEAPQVKTITAWVWEDENELLVDGGVGLIWDTVEWAQLAAMLPALRATVGEGEETIALTWSCADVAEGVLTAGTHTLVAILPEGYALAEGLAPLTLTLDLGGGDTYEGTGAFTVVGDPSNYTYEGNTLTITGGTVTVSMAPGLTETKTDKIVVNGTANVTLNGVTIDVNGTSYACAFEVLGTCHLTLEGTNTLKSGYDQAGLQVEEGAALTIGGQGSLTAQGSGDGAGIGGAWGDGGTIIITNGEVTATGGKNGAGIGGGLRSNGGNITISGGKVTATGGEYGAGIGGGKHGSGGTITIQNGTVEARGGKYSAGIGGNYKGSGGDITISGGSVTAYGGQSESPYGGGAGIGGGGYGGSGGNITISGGDVDAHGGDSDIATSGGGAGIGGGSYGNGGNITISGGTVKAYGGTYNGSGAQNIGGTGIGGGYDGSGGIIRIIGNVYAQGDYNADHIGNGRDGGPCIVFTDGEGEIRGAGDMELPENLTVGATETLTIPQDKTLIVPQGMTLTNKGTIDGPIHNEGKIIIQDQGTITGPVTGNQPFYQKGDFLVQGDPNNFTYAGNVLTITGSGAVTISGTTTQDRIKVAQGVTANITLNGLSINSSIDYAVQMLENSGINITLAPDTQNTLRGLYVGLGSPFSNGGEIIIGGSGSLIASGSARGIENKGNVTIKKAGQVTATGSSSGISCTGTITIQDSKLTATGSPSGNGIDSSAGDILIENSSVNATGGYYGIHSQRGGVTIKAGSKVTATSTLGWDGIYSDGAVLIENSSVTATGGRSGIVTSSGNIRIENSSVTATGTTGYGISSNNGGLNINGSQVTAEGGIVGIYSRELETIQNSIVFRKNASTNAGQVYGNAALKQDQTIPNGATLTIPKRAVLNLGGHTLTNSGTLMIDSVSCLSGPGTLNGGGDFYVELDTSMIEVPQNLVYTGQVLTPTFTLTGPTILGQTFTIASGWTLQDLGEVKNAGEYTVTYTKNGKEVKKTFTVAKSASEIPQDGITLDKAAYTYGDTITVTVAEPVPTGIAARTFAAPAKNQMAIFNGAEQISAPADPNQDGSYTMTVNTTDLGAGAHSLAARFVGNDNMAGTEKNFTVQVAPAALASGSFTVDTGAKTYTGTAIQPQVTCADPAVTYDVAYQNNVSVGTATITVTGKGNYGGTLTYTFQITKANPAVTWPRDLTGDAGKALSTVSLPEGFAWADGTTEIAQGEKTYPMIFTPADPANYNTLRAEISVMGRYVLPPEETDPTDPTVPEETVPDVTPPTITGIQDNTAYLESVTFTVTDDHLATVTVDGSPVTLTGGQYTIQADNKAHTVIATDQAGNKTTVNIRVLKLYIVTYKASGKVVNTQRVPHGYDAVAPQVPEKSGYYGRWDHNGKNITEDTVITAKYSRTWEDNPKTEDNITATLLLLAMSATALTAIGGWALRKRRRM